jgi:hypothetical protein
MINQSLVGSMMIDAEFIGSITVRSPTTAIGRGRGLKPLNVKTDPRIRLNWWWKKKKDLWINKCLTKSIIFCLETQLN